MAALGAALGAAVGAASGRRREGFATVRSMFATPIAAAAAIVMFEAALAA
jgi:hypothetical protein